MAMGMTEAVEAGTGKMEADYGASNYGAGAGTTACREWDEAERP